MIYTWGNVSGIDREKGLMVIEPSGVDYDGVKPEDIVVIDLVSSENVEGKWKPSSDTQPHLELYRAFPEIGGITHTHSINAGALRKRVKIFRQWEQPTLIISMGLFPVQESQ